jgi:DNA-binding transcriptional ArsR family regulator
MMPTDSPAPASLVDRFTERVARRDQPPQPDPHRFEPPQVAARIGRHLRARLGLATDHHLPVLVAVCLALIEQPASATSALAAAAGVRRPAANRAADRLQRAGLAEDYWDGHYHYYRLTRAGEDWLLAVVQDTLPEPAPRA